MFLLIRGVLSENCQRIYLVAAVVENFGARLSRSHDHLYILA